MDLWSHLEESLVDKCERSKTVEVSENVENYEDNPKHENIDKQNAELSFQNIISDLSITQQQKDVSLPFYFICLLHLANEKV